MMVMMERKEICPKGRTRMVSKRSVTPLGELRESPV